MSCRFLPFFSLNLFCMHTPQWSKKKWHQTNANKCTCAFISLSLSIEQSSTTRTHTHKRNDSNRKYRCGTDKSSRFSFVCCFFFIRRSLASEAMLFALNAFLFVCSVLFFLLCFPLSLSLFVLLTAPKSWLGWHSTTADRTVLLLFSLSLAFFLLLFLRHNTPPILITPHQNLPKFPQCFFLQTNFHVYSHWSLLLSPFHFWYAYFSSFVLCMFRLSSIRSFIPWFYSLFCNFKFTCEKYYHSV